MRGVTVTQPLVHDATRSWTVEDLLDIPDDGMRYEIFEGSLLVSPMANNRHARVIGRVYAALARQVQPPGYVSAFGTGINVRGGRSYFIPDLVVLREETNDQRLGVASSEVLLVVEVLSPSNARKDLILKRHEYAADKIPVYWIVDPEKQTITVLEHDGGEHYHEIAKVSPGEMFATEVPFPISLDPAEVF
jgi:Uma2 family endonuclease